MTFKYILKRFACSQELIDFAEQFLGKIRKTISGVVVGCFFTAETSIPLKYIFQCHGQRIT